MLNAYTRTAIECNCRDGRCDKGRIRQAAKFRAWLLAHAAQPCRPKRLEWKPVQSAGVKFIAAHVGAYEYMLFNHALGGSSVYYLSMLGESHPVLVNAPHNDCRAAAQAHFDTIWSEMTDCND